MFIGKAYLPTSNRIFTTFSTEAVSNRTRLCLSELSKNVQRHHPKPSHSRTTFPESEVSVQLSPDAQITPSIHILHASKNFPAPESNHALREKPSAGDLHRKTVVRGYIVRRTPDRYQSSAHRLHKVLGLHKAFPAHQNSVDPQYALMGELVTFML